MRELKAKFKYKKCNRKAKIFIHFDRKKRRMRQQFSSQTEIRFGTSTAKLHLVSKSVISSFLRNEIMWVFFSTQDRVFRVRSKSSFTFYSFVAVVFLVIILPLLSVIISITRRERKESDFVSAKL